MPDEIPPPACRRKKQPRPRIQRHFLDWLKTNQSRLAIPLSLQSRTDRQMTFSLVGLTPAIEVTLTDEIGIHVIREKEWWDALLFFEAWPVKKEAGFICQYCEPEFIVPYPSREALWTDHMFEPFLDWVNETLAKMRWLSLSQTEDGGGRWADLHTEWTPADQYRVSMIAISPQIMPPPEQPTP